MSQKAEKNRLYKVLEIAPDASEAEIKKAYRKLAMVRWIFSPISKFAFMIGGLFFYFICHLLCPSPLIDRPTAVLTRLPASRYY